MAAQLRPNRMEVTDRFPVLSLAIRIGKVPRVGEVVIATDPALFTRKEGRSSATFYTSREHGLLSLPGGESVFMVPPAVLARFVGAGRLWFGLATATPPNAGDWAIEVLPRPDSPYVSLSGLTDRALRRVRMFPTRSGFGGRGTLLDWAGDRAEPGTTAVPAPTATRAGTIPPAPTQPAPHADKVDVHDHYDDSFGPLAPLNAAPPPAASSSSPTPAPVASTPTPSPVPVSQGMSAAWTHALGDEPGDTTNADSSGVDGSADTQVEVEEIPYALQDNNKNKVARVEHTRSATTIVFNAAGQERRVPIVDITDAPPGKPSTTGWTIATGKTTDLASHVSYILLYACGKWGMGYGTEITYEVDGKRWLAKKANHNDTATGGPRPYDHAGMDVYVAVASSSSLAWAHGLSDDPEAYGIDTPPFSYVDDDAAVDAPATASALALGARENSLVTRTEASPNFNEGRGGKKIDRIIIHIADVPLVKSVVQHFVKDPNSKVSSHYLVGQDGEVIQFVSEADTARHCVGWNQRSIGIEHIAVKRGGANYEFERKDGSKGIQHYDALAPSQLEYETSAALVASLCDKYSLPINRTTIMGHREADTSSGHNCPDGNWDWDYFMRLVNSRTCQPQATTQGIGLARTLGQSFSIHWPSVPYIAQSTKGSCWAAATAMLVSWRDTVDISDRQVADRVGIVDAYKEGLLPEDRPVLAKAWNLVDEPPASYGINEFRDMLQSYGPLFLDMTNSRGESGHAWLLVGITSDGADDGSDTVMYLHNPTRERGKVKKSFTDFLKLYENRVDTSGGVLPCQVMHATSIPAGKQPVTAPQFTTSTAMALAVSRKFDASHALESDDWTINWDDVQMTPQPTNMGCWATAAAMVIGWRDNQSVDPTLLARCLSLESQMQSGLKPAEVAVFANTSTLKVEPNACFAAEGFRQLLEANGPIWVAEVVRAPTNFFHAVVVTGMYRSNGAYFVRITDPLDRVVGTPGNPGARTIPPTHVTGSRYIMTYEDFVSEFEAAAGIGVIQLMHSGGTFGHTINRGSAARVGYALGAEPPAPGGEFGYGVSLTRRTESGSGRSYDLAQLSGLVQPVNVLAGGAGQPRMPGQRIVLDDWPYIDGPNGRISAPVAIDWAWQGGAVGDVAIAPRQGQVTDGWTAQVRADIRRASGTPEMASLKLRMTTTFRRAGEEDQVAATEVVLNGDGRFQIIHGANSTPPSIDSTQTAQTAERQLQPA